MSRQADGWVISALLFTLNIVTSDRRKSNCVKEVEKIEQRRKERRKEQAAIKEQQEEQYDTTDPNWQFTAMIR